MKRNTLFLAAAVLGLAAFSSCGEKCVTCTYDVLGAPVTTEFCSSDSDERDAFIEAQQFLGATADDCVEE
jgi:hypothetical protein